MENLVILALCLVGLATPLLGRHSKRPMTSEEVNTMLKHYGVVPTIIDETKEYDQMTVVYNYTIFLDYGTKLRPEQIENKPTTLQWPVLGNELYSLVFIEPDHPLKSREKQHEFVHWLVVNIPGTQVEKGEEIAEYIGYRSFYEDKKPHRLIFLVYKQPSSEPMKVDMPRLIPFQVVERGHWYNFTARKFASEYKLTGPVSINLGFIDCERAWHGRKYKVFKNESSTTEVDLFPEIGETESEEYNEYFPTKKPFTPRNSTRKPTKKSDKKKS